jgi:hypothetical protein
MPADTNTDSKRRINRSQRIVHQDPLKALSDKVYEIGEYYTKTLPSTIDVQHIMRHEPILKEFHEALKETTFVDQKTLGRLLEVVLQFSEYTIVLRNRKLKQDKRLLLTLYKCGEEMLEIVAHVRAKVQ